ncbi:hypothetical protein B0H13DRAFT_1898509 [Mycena leptocephala]|nr:hypothetical protein B0H13DRAFT_1898509 [Mycena leptocephala]
MFTPCFPLLRINSRICWVLSVLLLRVSASSRESICTSYQHFNCYWILLPLLDGLVSLIKIFIQRSATVVAMEMSRLSHQVTVSSLVVSIIFAVFVVVAWSLVIPEIASQGIGHNLGDDFGDSVFADDESNGEKLPEESDEEEVLDSPRESERDGDSSEDEVEGNGIGIHETSDWIPLVPSHPHCNDSALLYIVLSDLVICLHFRAPTVSNHVSLLSTLLSTSVVERGSMG